MLRNQRLFVVALRLWVSACVFMTTLNTSAVAQGISQTAAQSEVKTNPPVTTAKDAKPVLVVRAKTDLANQGKPTLDLIDLERYFVERLKARGGIESVFSSATKKLSDPPAANEYLLELSVDALQPVVRGTQNDTYHRYERVRLVVAELSLKVKQASGGAVRGTVRASYESKVDSYNDREDDEAKHHALYTAADKLAKEFVHAAERGDLGEELMRPWWWSKINIPVLGVIAILVVLSIVLITIIVFAIKRLTAPRPAPNAEKAAPITPLEDHPEWDALLEEVTNLMVKTDNFSQAWIDSFARAHCEDILKKSFETERQEAHRQLWEKQNRAENWKIACYAAARFGLSSRKTYYALCEKDLLPYWILQSAKKIRK